MAAAMQTSRSVWGDFGTSYSHQIYTSRVDVCTPAAVVLVTAEWSTALLELHRVLLASSETKATKACKAERDRETYMEILRMWPLSILAVLSR